MHAALQSIVDASKSHIGWKFIYIAEAHATDEWPIQSARGSVDGEISNPQTRTSSDRLKLAMETRKKYLGDRWECYIDPPEGEEITEEGGPFMQIYKPWPLRVYGFVGKHLEFISEPKGGELDLTEIRGWLEGYNGF